MNYSKEEFNSVWKDTSKENILNQFYYEHIELQQALQKIEKAVEFIEMSCNHDYYYKYNGCLLKSEIKENILELLKEGDE